jgi:hypothetical protein
MKQIIYQLILLTSALSLFGCGSSNESNPSVLTKVTFVDKGPVTPYPTTTTITIESTSLTKTESQAGVVFGKLTKTILFADYTSIRKIIRENDIINTGDINRAPGENGCTGWGGMTIRIEDHDVHSFEISGAVCDMSNWPAEVRKLVTFKDAAANTYFCESPVPVSGQLTQLSPMYLIYFKSGVNAVTETNRLAALYGFAPSSIWDAIGGFSADLSPAVLESLRCEPTIQSIFFNGLASPS